MITNPERLKVFEHSLQKADDLSLEQKFRILEGMYQLARRMGHFTAERTLEGIEHDVALSKALHSLVRTNPR